MKRKDLKNVFLIFFVFGFSLQSSLAQFTNLVVIDSTLFKCEQDTLIIGDQIIVDNIFTFSDTIQSPAGCDTIFNYTIEHFNEIESLMADDIILCETTLPSFENAIWTNNRNPIDTIFKSGFYTLELVNQFGCTEKKTVEITLESDSTGLYIPNAFITPSFVGNSVFRVYPARNNSISDFELTIYASNGEKLFYSNDIEIGWDGTWMGQKVMPTNYVYLIKYKNMSCDKNIIKTGTILLLR